MIDTKKPKPGIHGLLSTIIMSTGILFLTFAVEDVISANAFMALPNLVVFVVSIAISYVVSEHSAVIHDMLALSHDALCGIVLEFFKGINLRLKSKIAVWYMEKETSEHVHALGIVLCFLLPASLLYVFIDFYVFQENALDSMLWGLSIFVYSNFVPDLPSIYRRGKENEEAEDAAWYQKYSLLLFAPLLIWAFYSGIRVRWRTAETFHNFRSLTVFGGFLLLLSFFAFGDLPFSMGGITEIVSLPLYGLIGYLTHLRVDKVW